MFLIVSNSENKLYNKIQNWYYLEGSKPFTTINKNIKYFAEAYPNFNTKTRERKKIIARYFENITKSLKNAFQNTTIQIFSTDVYITCVDLHESLIH